MLKITMIMMSFALVINCTLLAENGVWWEGENSKKTNFVTSDFLDKDIKKTRLSNMNWLTCLVKPDNKDKKESYSVEYEITVPEDGEYTFWAREFYRRSASPWKYRFDDGKWIEVTKDHKSVKGTIENLGSDRSVVWCKYNKVKLTKGSHKFEIIISEIPTKGFKAGFDAFLLIDGPFTPNRWNKPKAFSKKEYIGTFIWLEGEDSKNNFVNESSIPNSDSKLSKNKWIVCAPANQEDEKIYIARWTFTSQLSTSYNFWIRELDKKNESSFSYRINGGRWKKSTSDITSFDDTPLSNGTIACWVEYKKLYIEEGENTLEIKVNGQNKNGKIQLAIDAIMLSVETYIPAGARRPDTKIDIQKNWFLFQPRFSGDTKNKKSLFDWRKFNDSKSGIHGFCKVDKKGFVFADGTRPKFWGINIYDPIMMNKDAIKNLLKQLSNTGVNLVRINGSLCNPNTKRFGKVDSKIMDCLFYFIAECRKNGIYIALANYNPKDYLISEKDGLKGYTAKDKNKHPYYLLYTNKKYRNKYKKWATFLKRKNPYTGLRLYKDPTIVWFEIINGRNMLSVSLTDLPKEQKDILDTNFNAWLAKKYGDLGYVLKAWSEPKKYHPVIEEDGRRGSRKFRILPFSSYTKSIINSKKTDFFNKRKKDQLAFIVEEYQKINKELISYLKETCKFKGLISVGNSTPSANFILGGLNTYIKSSGDIIAENKFINPIRPKDINAPLKVGSFITGRSVLKNPLASPIIYPNYVAKGNVITEMAWSFPNKYRGEAVPFIAAYASLQGYNPFLWFQANSHSWANKMQKYTLQSPDIMGLFPGYALMFRRGDVKAARDTIEQHINLFDLMNLKGKSLNMKKLMKKEQLHKVKYKSNHINPIAFLIGKVTTTINKDKSSIINRVAQKNYWNADKKIIKSTTEELNLNYKTGELTINSPKAQAYISSASKGFAVKLKDVTISLQNKIGNVLVISLDNKPLATSKHILIQSFSQVKNNGWITEQVPQDKYHRLVNIGNSPLIIKKIVAEVAFNNISNKGWKMWKLSSDGFREKQLEISDSKLLTITLPSDSLYVELKK